VPGINIQWRAGLAGADLRGAECKVQDIRTGLELVLVDYTKTTKILTLLMTTF